MCGIFAYVNYGVPTQQKDIVEKLLNGLRRLEYRGYDSAGLAVDDGPGVGQLRPVVMKEAGKIDKLAALVRALTPIDRRANECLPDKIAASAALARRGVLTVCSSRTRTHSPSPPPKAETSTPSQLPSIRSVLHVKGVTPNTPLR
jgi:glutamate synthase domain-containing protein 1